MSIAANIAQSRFSEDLDNIFFQEFAVPVTIITIQGAPVESEKKLQGLFEDPYAVAQLGSYRVVSANPILICKWSDAKQLKHGDRLIIEDLRYCVEGTPHRDGTGVCRINLIEETLTDDITTEAIADYNKVCLGDY